jgi:probable F420-dependent oxidoreductase
MKKINIGAYMPSAGHFPAEHGVPEMATRLEQAGFSSLWVSDHVVMPSQIQAAYPFAKDKKATWKTDTPWYDAMMILAMVATVTKHVELGTAVLVLPLRHPVIFAKQAATIDALSGGRLTLGVGAGWLSDEFDALEVPFETRGKRLEEWINLSRNIWSGTPKAFKGAHYDLPPNLMTYPKPAHTIPFLIGGHSPPALKRAGSLCNGWLPQQSAHSIDPGALEQPISMMRSAAIAAGNDPDNYRVVLRINQSADKIGVVAEHLDALGAVGVDDIVVDVDWSVTEGPESAASILMD